MAFLDNTGVTRLVTDLKARFAALTHYHAATDITSGTLSTDRGGTGMTGNPSMLTNLGSTTADTVFKAGPRPGVTGILPVTNGGTGANTAAGAAQNIVDGQALAPASVAATGEVSAKSGTTTHKLTEKAEDTRADNLEASIAPVESTTATGNHVVGDLFMLGDVLKRVTSAISAGETISGSNTTDMTVAEYLKPTPITVTPATNASINKSDCFTACGVAFIALVIRVTADIGVDPDYPGYVTLATVNKLPATNVVAIGAYWNGSAYEMTDTPIRAADGKVQIYRPSGVNSTRLAYVNMFYKYV